MMNMGGLLKRMPRTGWTFIIGALALTGIFPWAGFWSKDEILAEAYYTGVQASAALARKRADQGFRMIPVGDAHAPVRAALSFGSSATSARLARSNTRGSSPHTR